MAADASLAGFAEREVTAGETLGLSRSASEVARRAAALRELGLSSSASAEEIRKRYRHLAMERHPDRVGSDPEAQRKWQRLQAAVAILRPPADQHSPQEEDLWKEALDLAEPLAAGLVDGVGDLLSKYSEKLRTPRAAAGGPAASPSLIRTVAADAAQAAVASGQRAVLGRMGKYFERLKNEKP